MKKENNVKTVLTAVQFLANRFVTCTLIGRYPDKDEMKKIINSCKEYVKDIDFTKLTSDELLDIGCLKWTDDLYLFPLSIFKMLPPDLELTGIDGKKEFVKFCDDDIRGGCVAYGLKVDYKYMFDNAYAKHLQNKKEVIPTSKDEMKKN